MSSLNTFTIHDDEVWIGRPDWKRVAFTTYSERFFKELSSVTWTENQGYLFCSKFGSLHRYIMRQWYGDETLKSFTNNNCVVDHMDNDGLNCRISNLEFLVKPRNTAKGYTIDKDIRDLQTRIAIGIYKDFTTNMYQIGLGFNDPFYKVVSGKLIPIQSLYLLYECDYEEVLVNVSRIINDFSKHSQIDTGLLKPCAIHEVFAESVVLTSQEKEEIITKGRVFVEREGDLYFIPGKNCWLKSTGFIKGWLP